MNWEKPEQKFNCLENPVQNIRNKVRKLSKT